MHLVLMLMCVCVYNIYFVSELAGRVSCVLSNAGIIGVLVVESVYTPSIYAESAK